tara:strand:- start:2585 stop:3610 length:1026 start_codon:yes stop_codon:yes gene_type:complete
MSPKKKTATKKATRKTAVKKSAAPKKKAAKKSPVKKTIAKKTAVKKKPVKTVAKKAVKKAVKKAAAKKAPAKKASRPVSSKTPSSILKTNVPNKKRVFDEKKITPIVFSLDDVNALLATRKETPKEDTAPKPKVAKKTAKKPASRVIQKSVSPSAPISENKRVLGAASLADILGFDPAKKQTLTVDGEDIPQKWKVYYKLLLDLRNHVQEELDLHTAETLKHTSGDDAGDVAHYGNHQADSGTDSFDRDFALSLVSSEQDALNEIEEAIQRMRDGSYGVCEVTGKPIKKDRLLAVPFARFSIEGQKEFEKNNRRKLNREAGNLFGDGDETLKLSSDDDGEE